MVFLGGTTLVRPVMVKMYCAMVSFSMGVAWIRFRGKAATA
jgi:hypothetical protein